MDTILKINYIVPRTYAALPDAPKDEQILRLKSQGKELHTERVLKVIPGVTRIHVINYYGDDSHTFYWYLQTDEKLKILKEGKNFRSCVFTVPLNATGEENLDIDVLDFMYDRRWLFSGPWDITRADFSFEEGEGI